jgi:hypothetical protein
MERISSYISSGITPSSSTDRDCEKKPVDLVLGFRAQYIRRYWEPKRHVGKSREIDEKGDPVDWPESSLRHFDIDGPGGEYITEIEAATVDFPAAIKVSF